MYVEVTFRHVRGFASWSLRVIQYTATTLLVVVQNYTYNDIV